MIKSVEYIAQPWGRFIIASGGEMKLFLVSGASTFYWTSFYYSKEVLICVELNYKIWSYIFHQNWAAGFNLNINKSKKVLHLYMRDFGCQNFYVLRVLMHFLSGYMPINVLSVIKDQTLYIQDYIEILNMRIITLRSEGYSLLRTIWYKPQLSLTLTKCQCI